MTLNALKHVYEIVLKIQANACAFIPARSAINCHYIWLSIHHSAMFEHVSIRYPFRASNRKAERLTIAACEAPEIIMNSRRDYTSSIDKRAMWLQDVHKRNWGFERTRGILSSVKVSLQFMDRNSSFPCKTATLSTTSECEPVAAMLRLLGSVRFFLSPVSIDPVLILVST